MASPRKRIGELLVAAGVIDALDLQAALAHQRQWGGQLGATLIDRGFISESALVETLAEQLKLPIVRLTEAQVDPQALELVPVRLCEQLRVFPLRFERGADASQLLVLAMVDPTDLAAIDQVKYQAGRGVQPALAADQDIGNAIRRHYHGRSDPLASIPPATSPSIDPFSDLKSMGPRLPPSMVPPQVFRDNSPISVAVPLEDPVESGEFSFPAESIALRDAGSAGELDDIEIDVEGFDEDLALEEPAPPAAASPSFQEIDPVAEGWLTPSESTGAPAALSDEPASEWESVAPPESMASSSAGGAPAIDWGPLDEQVDLGEGWEEQAPMSIAAVPWAEEPTNHGPAAAESGQAQMAALESGVSDAAAPEIALELEDPFAISEAEAALPTRRVALGTKATTWVEPPGPIVTGVAPAAESTPEGTGQPAPGDSDWSALPPSEVGAAALWATAPIEEETSPHRTVATAPEQQDWSVAGEPGAAAQWATSSTLAQEPRPEVRGAAGGVSHEATTTFESFASPVAEQTVLFLDDEEPATISGEAARPSEPRAAPPADESTSSFVELQAPVPAAAEPEQPIATPPPEQVAEELLVRSEEAPLPAEPAAVEPPVASEEVLAAPEEPHHVTYALSADEPTTDGTTAAASWSGPATDWALGISSGGEQLGAAAVWATSASSPAPAEPAVSPESAEEGTGAAGTTAPREAIVPDELGALDEALPVDAGSSALSEEETPPPETSSPAGAALEAAPAIEERPVEAAPELPSTEMSAGEADFDAFEGPPLDEATVSESIPETLAEPAAEPHVAAFEAEAPSVLDSAPAEPPGGLRGMTPAPAAVRPERAELTPPARVTFPPGKGPPVVEDVAEPLRGWRLIGIESPTPTDAVQVMGALVDLLVSRGAVSAEELAELMKKLRDTPL